MSKWFSRRPDDDPAAVQAYNAMTHTFLQADHLITEIEDGVSASRESDPTRQLSQRWAPLRQRHFDATARYLQLQRPTADSPYAPAGVYIECNRVMEQVCADTARFGEHFADQLGRARAGRQLAREAAQQARRDAHAAATALDQPETLPYLHYPSVTAALDVLSAQMRKLDSLTDSAGLQEAASALSEAAASVRAALAAAPNRASEAQNAARSVATRISAVATRSERIGPARSALLREFSAACSRDLVDNDRIAAHESAAAEVELNSARTEIANGRPEVALAHCQRAREHLATADQAVDAVTDRLQILREVRAGPQAAAAKVRFRLRDAQQLAMQRDQVKEWGSVLDAQVERINRASAALDGVHPDYWAYLTDLEAIGRFIDGIVDRLRGRA